MAENKKSFVLYCDLIHTIGQLPNEKAGELFKHILLYVNDHNPVTEDIIINIAFEPIKQQLKRDLIKWDNERKSRSDAGKKGMEKRWGENNKHITKDNTVINDITNITDNVTVNVNVINKVPSEAEFLEYCKTIKEYPFSEYEYSIKSKYESWVANGWKDGHDSEIKNWKSKIKNTLPHLKPTKKPIKQNYLGGLYE